MPEPTPITQRFWDALRAHRIEIQRCRECRAWFFDPRAACPRCWSTDLEWAEISGRGRICSFTIARVPTAPHFRDESPQRIAIVELDEGPRLTTTIPGSAPEELRVGLRVRPVCEDVRDRGITLLRYAVERE